MCVFIFLLFIGYINSPVESTDLAAVYGHGVIRLRDVDASSAAYSLDDKTIYLQMQRDLAFPVGLSFDPVSKNIFIADVNDYKADIYAFSTVSKGSAEVKKIIRKEGISSIESLTYDPIKGQLYWTDSYKDGIYYASTHGEEGEGVAALVDNAVHKPRGIAIDYCYRRLFWSERDSKLRGVTDHNLFNGTNEQVMLQKEDIFYQGMAYSMQDDQLILAETVGDSAINSSCNIIKYSGGGQPELYASIERCYPFSLAVDSSYIYWTDWARKGILRLSKTNPKDLVMLISTPAVETKEGLHSGSFGLVKLDDFDSHSCEGDNGAITLQKTPSTILPIDIKEDLSVQLHAAVQEILTPVSSAPQESHESEESIEDSLARFKRLYNRVHYMFIVALLVSCIFMVTSFILLLRWKCARRSNASAVHSAKIEIESRPKIFRALKLPAAPHRPAAGDSVRIDIEDCCQMTLCDKPCFTSLKKEGRQYLQCSSGAKKEDKKKLLDNTDLA